MWSVLIGTAAALGGGARETAAGTAPARPAPAPVPARAGVDLSRLAGLQDAKATPAQKAQLGLRLLEEERARPAPRPALAEAGTKAHYAVLARITRALAASEADAALLRQAYDAGRPGEVRDCLLLCLGLRESTDLQRPLALYLQNPRNPPALRALAAEALGVVGAKTRDADLGELLFRTLRQDVQAQYDAVPDLDPTRPARIEPRFPVKEAAAAAVRRMEQAGTRFPSYVTRAARRVEQEATLAAGTEKK